MWAPPLTSRKHGFTIPTHKSRRDAQVSTKGRVVVSSLPEDQILRDAREVIRREGNATAAVAEQLDGSFVAAVSLLLGCRGKVVVTGSGTSGTVARRMAHLLSVCGTPSVFLHPMDALHGALGAVSEVDVVIAISKSGNSTELNDFARRAQERGAQVLSLTSRADSVLGQLANLSVQIVSDDDADPGGFIAMGSTLATSAWGDALAVTLMRMRGYSWSEVLFTHPAGAVGQLVDIPAELAPLRPPATTDQG
jgi:D-arabinose 5-phosphate isomerase GutQ